MKGRAGILLNIVMAVIAVSLVVILLSQNNLVDGEKQSTSTPWRAPLLVTETATATPTNDTSWYANLPSPRPVIFPTATITRTPTRTTTPPTATPISDFDMTLTAFPTLNFPTAGATSTPSTINP